MRIESAVTSVSWIPSEAMAGLMRMPMDIGLGHYDDPPPDEIDDFAALIESDGCRFANRLSAFIDLDDDGSITDAGYSGSGLVGTTVAGFGRASIRIPGVGYPEIRDEPAVSAGEVTFVQTAGGRTGAPFPRKMDRAPYVTVTAPTAWTTLALTIKTDGTSEFEVRGASPFPTPLDLRRKRQPQSQVRPDRLLRLDPSAPRCGYALGRRERVRSSH